MIFYFSGTGNSKWIANQLSKVQKEDLVFIPDALRDGTSEFCLREDEKVGFVFPIYSWAPPAIVLRFIQKLSLKGYNGQYLFFVCSCGDDTGLTQKVLTKALKYKGWECHAGFSVTMPNNYVLLPGFDVDNKELERKKLAESIPNLKRINTLISRKECVFSCYEGSIPFIKTRIINPLFNCFQMSPEKFLCYKCLCWMQMLREELSGEEYNYCGREACVGKRLYLMPGMLSCMSSASSAIWEKNKRKGAIFQPRLISSE